MTKSLLAALSLILALNGCAVLTSKETFAACKVADVATTIFVLHKGGAEANPLMASVVAHWGYLGLIGVSAALVALVWYYHDSIPEPVMGAINVGQCGVVAHNVGVIGSMKP